MAKTGVMTGVAEIDAKLKLLEPKLQKKFTRQALRKSGKRVLADLRQIIRSEAYDTGAYEKSTGVRALKRSRTRIGVSIVVDRNKLQARKLKAQGKVKETKLKDILTAHKTTIDEAHYYPASIEFGYKRKDGTEVEAIKPQRRSLYDNKATTITNFQTDMQELVREAGSKTT
jgi:hypothetical protein